MKANEEHLTLLLESYVEGFNDCACCPCFCECEERNISPLDCADYIKEHFLRIE